MTLFRDKYRIETTRLRHWDYAASGYYFVTICAWRRQLLFGEVKSGEVQLSPIGEVVADEWRKTPAIRSNVELDSWIVMPNHLHGILVIANTVETRRGASLPAVSNDPPGNRFGPLKPGSLQSVVNNFKGAVTRRCRVMGVSPPVWQPRFHEHVIRDEPDLNHIREYIQSNPLSWKLKRDEDGLWM